MGQFSNVALVTTQFETAPGFKKWIFIEETAF